MVARGYEDLSFHDALKKKIKEGMIIGTLCGGIKKIASITRV